MGRWFRKYLIIMWKNYLVKKRHWFVTFLEVFIPILAFLLLILLRLHLKDLEHYSMENPIVFPPVTDVSVGCDGLIIMYSPKNEFTRNLIKMVTSELKTAQMYPCINEVEMERKLHTLKGESSSKNIFGIVFEEISTNMSQPHNFSYTIRPDREAWYTYALTPTILESGPMNISDQYIRNCFISLQLALDKALILHSIKAPDDSDFPFKFVFQGFPYPAHTQDSAGTFLYLEFLPFCTSGSFIIFFVLVVKRIAEEKATGAKEFMCMMGMSKAVQWLGWLSSSLILVLVNLLIIVLFLVYGFEDTPILRFSNGYLIFLFLFLYCLTTILCCFVIADFFSKGTLAIFTIVALMMISDNLPHLLHIHGEFFPFMLILSLLPNSALVYGYNIIATFEGRGIGLHWNNIWTKPRGKSDELSMGNVFTMFVVSNVISIIVVWYLDRVRPGKFGVARPWYFPISKVYSKARRLLWKNKDDEYQGIDLTYDSKHKGQFEPLPPGKSGIEISRLRKVFGRSNWLGGRGLTVAIDGVSLDILEGEITALLGHNGAGKTTLISILTGHYSASGGKVFMGGYDIEKDMDTIRENLGLCPQQNMLFSDLSVWEHLIFFAMCKGSSFQEAKSEAQVLLSKLQLEAKRYELASSLSGGMKRKLALGMALIGKSKILMLDEPTSGLDPESRRHVWDMLRGMRGECTILLTTHYMEEADVLGDRIAIMDHGKVKCYGTSLFLKKVYGTGYHLTLLIDSDITNGSDTEEVKSNVTDLVKQMVPGAQFVHHSGNELKFTLPTASTESFPSLFVQLDKEGKSLGINGLTLSVTTLEEVFLKVGKLDEEEARAEGSTLDHAASDVSSSSLEQEALNAERVTGFQLMVQQVEALCVKKLHFAKAMWIQLLLMCFFGIFLVLMIIVNTSPHYSPSSHIRLEFSISDYKNSKAFTSGNELSGVKAEDIYMKLLSERGTSVTNVTWNEVTNALLEAGANNEYSYREDYVVSATFDNLTVTPYYSTVLYHSCPTSLNLATTTLLRLLTNDMNASITTTIHAFPNYNFHYILSGGVNKFINAIYWMMGPPFGLLVLTSAFIMLPVLEGAHGARHLQLMTMSSSLSLFWILSFLFDMAIYLICVLLILMIFPIFAAEYPYESDFYGALFVIFLLFGLSTIPFAYLISYSKKRIESGLSLYVNICIFYGWIMGPVVTVTEILNVPTITHILQIISLWVPYFSLSMSLKKFSVITTYNYKCSTMSASLKERLCSWAFVLQNSTDVSCCENLCNITDSCFEPISYFHLGSFGFNHTLTKWEPEGMGVELLTLGLLCPIYFGILYCIDKGILSNSFEKFVEFLMYKCEKNSEEVVERCTEDEDVLREKDRLDFVLQSDSRPEGKDTLIAHKLKKNYGWFRWPRRGVKAVKGVSFGVDSGDCFGLLGANGAGKTSTFGMITGSHPISGGTSFLLGERSANWNGRNQKYQVKIGYCPQFNATLGFLTGRQTLRLYGCLRGFPKKIVDQEVQRWLNQMDLNELADRPCKTYSGGNLRRVNTAIALIGERRLICLDEPMAGVDPIARRRMWDAVNSARSSGAAVVLTSHSMEECEALCTKLAIMVNGQFVCFGPVPQLKLKFGQGFTLLVKLNLFVDTSDSIGPTVENLKDCIETRFHPCTLKDEHKGLLLHYHIIESHTKWDFMFSTMEELKRTHSPLIEDYSISDTTLEQVFLSFMRAKRDD